MDTADRTVTRRSLLTGLVTGGLGAALGAAAGYHYPATLRHVELGVRADEIDVPPGVGAFRQQAAAIVARQRAQTVETVKNLKQRYEGAVFGRVRVWDLVERLAQCVDPTDMRLYGASQFMHLQQILATMEYNGIDNRDLLLLAIVHDLGKVLLLGDELPEHIVGLPTPIGIDEAATGLEKVVYQFGHGEFIYSRLKDHVPEVVAFAARYHNVKLDAALPYMTPREREFTDTLLRPFQRFDSGVVSAYYLPKVDMRKYRALIEDAFPNPILV